MAYGRYRTGLVQETAKKKWNPNWGKKAEKVIRGSTYTPIATPSLQQTAIFDDVVNNSEALIVDALAGTGKTAVCADAMRKLQIAFPEKSIAYFIFATRNAREAEGKLAEPIVVRTVHSLGLAALRRAYGITPANTDDQRNKSYNIALALLGPEDEKAEIRHHFMTAISLAKGYLCETVEKVLEICEKHEVDYCDHDPKDFAAKVLQALDLSAKQYMRVEFDDMIWLPIRLNLQVDQYDYVFADEQQDLSPARQELVLRAVKPGGKFVGVGDEHQAIFGFTGADEEAITSIQKRTNARRLPLTTTYRCAKSIVRLAQQYVPEYTAAEGNPEGEVSDKTLDQMLKFPEEGGVGPGDFIISRTNAPLIKLAFSFIRQGRKASILGKDLGKNLAYMIKRSKAESVSGFLSWLDEWKNTEIEKLVARNKPSDHIDDKYNCLLVLTEGQRTLPDVVSHIDEMFSDKEDANKIVLLTAHKSKGLEKNRVFLLTYTFKCKGNQEANVFYVAISRARQELYMVSEG